MKKGLFDKFRDIVNDAADEYQKRNDGKSILEEVIGKREEENDTETDKKGGGLFDKWFGRDEAEKGTVQDEENELEKRIREFDNRSDEDDFDEAEKQKDATEQLEILEEKFEGILEELVAKHKVIREKLANEHNRREIDMAKKLQARLDRMKEQLS